MQLHVANTDTMPDMPDLGPASYLFEIFQQTGKCAKSDQGFIPISWAELDAFRVLSQSFSPGFEAEVLREMSVGYVQGVTIGFDEFGKPPYEGGGPLITYVRKRI